MKSRFWVVLLLAGCAHGPTPAVESLVVRHVKRDGPNHQHVLRLFAAAPELARAEGADLEVVQLAALLHDVTKEDGTGTPFERFCTHHAQAAAVARLELPTLGYSSATTARVAEAIEQHMGPLGENPEFHAPRFMSGFCQREYPRPSTAEARVLFDLDMLDLMTVQGVVKVVTLRQRNAEFAKETLEQSALTGKDSAWKSVVDAQQVLVTSTAQRRGAEISARTRQFLESVDFSKVTSVEAFSAAAARFAR